MEFKSTPSETADTIANYVKETLEKNGLAESVWHSQVTTATQCLKDSGVMTKGIMCLQI